MTLLHLTIPARAKRVPIHIGSGALRDLSAVLRQEQFDRLLIVCDEAVADIARGIAPDIACTTIITVPSGEQSKNFAEVQRLTRELLKFSATRHSIVIAIGGGMVTDLVGFTCSIFMRGIRFVSVPTSLLCMVDAAVGGKTGIDVDGTKNVIGTIRHPIAILMDTATLASLPEREYQSGLVEVVKMATMLDAESFRWLEHHLDAVLRRDATALQTCIERAVRMKTAVVEIDEEERSQRMFFNFGHTVGHALETHSAFRLSHGQAVSRGMAMEMALAGTQEADRVIALLAALSMPTQLPAAADAEALWMLMMRDKKTVNGTVRIAVPDRIGTGSVHDLPEEHFRSLCA